MFFPDCGIGGPTNPDGSCSGTLGPGGANQAGAHVWDGITASGVVHAFLAAGVIMVAVIFAIWAVRKVASFFGGGELSLTEQDDAFWRAAGNADRAARDPDEGVADNLAKSYRDGGDSLRIGR